MIERASVVLPQPDSPASARISPSAEREVHAVDRARGDRVLLAAQARGRDRRTARGDRCTCRSAPASTDRSDAVGVCATSLTASLRSSARLRLDQEARRAAIRRRTAPTGDRSSRTRGSNASRAPRVEAAAAGQLPRVRRIAVQPRRRLDVALARRSCGNAPARASVYGCCGSRNTDRRPVPPRRCGPRTSPRAGR